MSRFPEKFSRKAEPRDLPEELRFLIRDITNRDGVTIIVADDFHDRTWTAVHPDNDAWLHITTGNGEVLDDSMSRDFSTRAKTFYELVLLALGDLGPDNFY